MRLREILETKGRVTETMGTLKDSTIETERLLVPRERQCETQDDYIMDTMETEGDS